MSISIRRATAAGKDLLLDLDTQGAASIRRALPDAILIFIMPPSLEALRERLRGRGTEDPAALDRRIALAQGEIDRAPTYDYVVVNDDFATAYDRLRAIVLATRCRTRRGAGGREQGPGSRRQKRE